MVPLTVVGICSYHPAVHRWFATLREHFDGPCLLYLTDPEEGLSEQLAKRYGATVIPVQVEADFWAKKHTGMFCGQWRYVLDACTARVTDGFVLRTDVWDVVFQDDPRRHIDPSSRKIAVCREGWRIADLPMNRVWVKDWLPLFAGAGHQQRHDLRAATGARRSRGARQQGAARHAHRPVGTRTDRRCVLRLLRTPTVVSGMPVPSVRPAGHHRRWPGL